MLSPMEGRTSSRTVKGPGPQPSWKALVPPSMSVFLFDDYGEAG